MSSASSPKPGQFTAMISSTALDLPKHRAAVKEACLAAGIFPIGMEHLPAQDASGVEVSMQMVDQADIYLGIYAWRYGWVPDGGTVSITELEYERALERQKEGQLKELLIFTAHDDHPFTKKDIETDAEAQSKLEAFKKKACDGLVRKEFSSVEELGRLVGHALDKFMSRHAAPIPTATEPAPPKKTLNNLPRLEHFFGRKKELKIIAKALLPQTRTWGVLIDGPGGMGKTALAVRAAELASGQFDCVHFITTKIQRLTPQGTVALGGSIVPAYSEILSQMARLLGLAHATERPEAERAALIKTALQQEKALYILDNLENLDKPQQDLLYAFLQDLPPTCKALVTSRRRTDVEARLIRLEKLDQDAALELLAELESGRPLLKKASKEDRLHLYEETGGNPLLLRWVAGQLGRGSCRTLKGALELCRKAAASKDDPLEFIFGDLLETFTSAETQALAALTYFTQKIEVEFIAELAGLSPTATRTALADLANRALVMPDEAEEKFALVPMVADFLRRKRPEVVAETGNRLEKRAYALIWENGRKKHDHFPVLDAAWPSVAPAIPLFLAGPNARLQQVCGALQFFLNFTGRWDEWLALSQQAETRALAAGDQAKAVWRVYEAGMIHYLRRQADEVLACAERAAAHWARAFPPGSSGQAGIRERAAAIQLRGLGHLLKQEYNAAITAYGEVVELFRSLCAESEDVALGLNNLAEAEGLSDDFDAAERDFREALRVARAVGYDAGIATYTGNLAALALQRQDWPGAEALARDALPLAEKVGRQELIASNCQRIAEALVRQGRGAEGLPHGVRAVDIFTRLGMPGFLAGAQETLAACEAAAGGSGGEGSS
ncbi:DUF4062 domain-containing protein [Prosthecobacter sp.]|uniref:DUF4062 domain-containing protein n=1 Tax=Prosthecobacter sp. TaxID=1965333 RepID=UPI0024893677|nr:DUF4062 domain-containing protein [Prosthecobacter sp.]MDI1314422.1 DUF4062 domain-containing protein [Prosthecobacter sp.]